MITRLILVCAAFFVPMAARAGPLLGAGLGLFIEQEGRQKNYETRLPFFVKSGWAIDTIDAFVEYSWFSAGEGEGSVAVDRRLESVLGWGVYKFRPVSRQVVPTASAGLGAIAETVRTRAASQIVTSRGKARLAAAAGVGVIGPLRSWIDISLDLRVVACDGLQPNPAFWGAAGFGLRF